MGNLIVNHINGQGADVGKAKGFSFLNVQGGSPTVLKSYNVSSLTDMGTGKYGHNLTSAMADTNYSLSALSKGDGANTYLDACERFDTTRTPYFFETNSIHYSNGSTGDSTNGFSTILHGDLA